MVRVHQGYTQQGAPGLAVWGQKAKVVNARIQIADAHHPVLTQGKLQQLLPGVISRYTGAMRRLCAALTLTALGQTLQTLVRGIEQIQLAQLTPRQGRNCANALRGRCRSVTGPGHTGKLLQQQLGISQRLRDVREHLRHLMQTHTAQRRWCPAWRARGSRFERWPLRPASDRQSTAGHASRAGNR